MSTSAFIDVYWGIGDAIYLNPVVRKVAARHSSVYVCTPFPILWGNIPNIKPINPFKFMELGSMPRLPMYYDAVYGISHWYDDDYVKDTNLVHYKPSTNGEGFQEGCNMIDDPLPGESVADPVLWFPGTSFLAKKTAEHFLEVHNPSGKPPLLFHPYGRGRDGALPARSAPDSVATELFDSLSKDFFLFDATRWISEFYFLFSQSKLPVFHSSGWIGLEITMALIERSVAVAMQGSCSLLPMAMAAGKPILCANGSCNQRIKHLSSDKLQPIQRRIVALEPDPYCGCLKHCGAVNRSYYDTDRALQTFRNLIG